MTNHPPINKSPMLNPPNRSQRISRWSPGRAARQTLTGDPYLPKTGIFPPFVIVATALHAEPTNARRVCGLSFLGLFSHSTTTQKLMQHSKFGKICQMILVSMTSIFSADSALAHVNTCSFFLRLVLFERTTSSWEPDTSFFVSQPQKLWTQTRRNDERPALIKRYLTEIIDNCFFLLF